MNNEGEGSYKNKKTTSILNNTAWYTCFNESRQSYKGIAVLFQSFANRLIKQRPLFR